jgi:hypothetical protein
MEVSEVMIQEMPGLIFPLPKGRHPPSLQEKLDVQMAMI